jgi:hypothetical protein
VPSFVDGSGAIATMMARLGFSDVSEKLGAEIGPVHHGGFVAFWFAEYCEFIKSKSSVDEWR